MCFAIYAINCPNWEQIVGLPVEDVFIFGSRRMGRSSVMLLTCTCGCKLAFWLIGATYVLLYRSVCLIGIRPGLRRRGGVGKH